MEPADTEKQQAQTGSPADPGAATAARRWRSVFPEAMGVAIAGTIVAGLVAVGTLANYTVRRQNEARRASEGQALANVLARAVALLDGKDEAETEVAFGQLCREHRAIRSAEWIGRDGRARCRWPGSASVELPADAPAERVAPPGGAAIGPAADTLTTFSAAVRTATGAPAGTVNLSFAFPEIERPSSYLIRGCAIAACGTLLIYFALYRYLRRHLRPVDAIQRNLLSYAAGLEKEFVALSLSDSLGNIAQSWNHLIEQLAALREQDTETAAPDLAHDAMRRYESRTLRSTLDRLPIGLLRFGPDQRVTYANVAAGRFIGQPCEKLLGVPLADVIEEEIRAPLVGAYLRSMAAMSIDRKRGTDEQQTTLRFAVIPPAESSPDGEALVTIEDVSHLQEADRARDNFLYHVTHELRTPLTNIQAYAETLTGPGFDDEQTRRECYNVIISETRRLSRLVEDILNISQLEVGTARIEMGEVDLVRLVRQIVQDHLGTADEKQIDLTLKLAPKVPKVKGDKQRLSVLITNLIGNAIKYTPHGGQVVVTLDVHEKCLEVSVTDTGIGIAPEDQPHVFEKFYRAVSDEVQTIAGTGLGLAIAREVARLHGGDIRLESEPAHGSRFVVELPRPPEG